MNQTGELGVSYYYTYSILYHIFLTIFLICIHDAVNIFDRNKNVDTHTHTHTHTKEFPEILWETVSICLIGPIILTIILTLTLTKRVQVVTTLNELTRALLNGAS